MAFTFKRLFESTFKDDGFYHEIKKHLLLGSKVMTNLDSILQKRDIGLEESILSKWLYYPKQSIDSMQSLSS